MSTILDLGYNDFIDRDQRHFHIQTEVIESNIITIKTTIMENGLVIDTVTFIYNQENHDLVRMKYLVEEQHQRSLSNINGGKYD